MDVMSVANLSMALSQTELLSGVQTAVLDKSLDTLDSAGAGMVKSLESLASPATMGTQIDIQV